MTEYEKPVVYPAYHNEGEDPYTPDTANVSSGWVTMLWLFDPDAETYGTDNIRRKVRIPREQVQCLHTIEREERPDDE